MCVSLLFSIQNRHKYGKIEKIITTKGADIMQEVDVIIPLYKPGKEFLDLLDRLETQSVPVHQIILFNTEQKYWDKLNYDNPRRKRYQNIKLRHISKREFDHGKTRREAVKKSTAPIFVMMTQDAMPADEFLIERLIKPLEDRDIAVSYARQLPRNGADPVERFVREFNYPPQSRVKSKADLKESGIKTYFCSNVCAAYRREIYDAQGGFIKRAIFNEDMIYAAGCINAGYKIAYTADARVIHSHQYTNKEQFRRNFDIGVSQAEHPEIFESVLSESEGIKLVRQTASFLKKEGEGRLILPMYITSIYKLIGYKLGKNYKKLSFRRILKYTMNKDYWNV